MLPSNIVIYFPLFIIQMYLMGTLALYVIGPVAFQKTNTELVVVLVLIYIICFSIGYLAAAWCRLGRAMYPVSAKEGEVKTCFLLFAIGYALSSLYVYVPGFSIFSFFSILRWAISEPLRAYQAALYNSGSPLVNYSIVLLYPLYFYVIVRSLLFFRSLSIHQRALLLLILTLELSRWIMMGRNKGVFDVFFVIGTVLLIRWAAGVRSHQHFFTITRKTFFMSVFLASALLLALSFFSNSIVSRKAFVEDYQGYRNNLLIEMAPDSLTPLIVNLTDYLAQGYHSLSHVFYMDWLPSYGVGHSPVLIANFGQALGITYEDSYQFRMSSFGIDPYVNWHTAYLWLANDIHWFGVSIFMVLFGYYFFSVYFKSVAQEDVVSCCIFALLVVSVFYIPANVQIFSSTATLFAFYVFVALGLARKLRLGLFKNV